MYPVPVACSPVVQGTGAHSSTGIRYVRQVLAAAPVFDSTVRTPCALCLPYLVPRMLLRALCMLLRTLSLRLLRTY